MNCLILGGGQSLLDILKGRTCKKEGWFTIGVNLAYLLGDWIDICFFMDALMWWNHEDGLRKFKGRKITLNQTMKNNVSAIKSLAGVVPGVEIWDNSVGFGISDKKGHILQNRSSGAAAINLAYHLGAKRIFLAGYNMHGDANGWRMNWYPDQYKKIQRKGYHNMLAPFDKIAEDSKRLNLEILNATPGSAITQFPFVDLEDFKCLT